MTKKMSHTACFQAYGTVPGNVRWSWSARSPDGKVVSVTLWKDRFEDGTKIYRSQTHLSDPKWLASPGHAEMLRNLAWARDNCDGEVRVIVALPVDPDASPRSIRECYPAPNLRMRVTDFNEGTGEFVLRRIS